MITFLTKKSEQVSKNKKEKKKKREVKQVKSEETKPNGVDFIAPSIIKETIPGDISFEGTVNDYLVEVGGTNETVRYFRSFMAEITGGNTWAGMLDELILGEFGKGDTDLAIHIEPVDSSQELEDINRRIQGLESDLMTEKNQAKIVSIRDELQDLKDRQKRLRQNIEKPFRVSIQAVASSTDLKTFKKYCNNLIRKFAGKEIIMRSPDGKQLEALLNITPLSSNFMYKEHTFSYETTNVADFFPFGHGSISHRDGIIWGRDDLGRPIYYNGWNKKLMNHNIIITGRSGGGKTVSALKLINRSVLKGVKVAIICPKGDYRKYVLAMGCPYIDLSPDSPHKINFFDVDIEERIDGTTVVNLESTIVAARAIVFKMIRIMDEEVLTGKVKVKIGDYIRQLYSKKKITNDPASLYDNALNVQRGSSGNRYNLKGQLKKMPQLGDLYLLLKEDPDTQEVAELLKNFTKYGNAPAQAIFDTESTVKIQDVPIFAFGLSELDEEIMRPLGLFIATKWQSTKFAKKNRHQKKYVVFDEAQEAMKESETAIWLENEFRIQRFFNTGMVAITQGFEVFTRNPQGLGILKNAPTKLFLRQEKLDIEEIQGKFDLTEGEASFLVNKAEKGLGILRIDEEASIIQVDTTKTELALFDTDPSNIENNRMYLRKKGYYVE